MRLDAVVPFGRSFDEYVLMFALGEGDRHRRIIGVGDGPASFNAEATRRGWRVTSVDPLYRVSAEEILERFHAVLDGVIDQVRATPERWTWTYHGSPEALRAHRGQVLADFSADFAAGRRRGRYIAGGLPSLPFAQDSFDIALCSHLLFLYTDLLCEDFHIRSLLEMLRVAPEARVFPLLSLDGGRSRHLRGVLRHLAARGHEVSIRRVPYELQRGGNEVLIVRRAPAPERSPPR